MLRVLVGNKKSNNNNNNKNYWTYVMLPENQRLRTAGMLQTGLNQNTIGSLVTFGHPLG